MSHQSSYLTLRRLAYFATIAEVGSIRGAANTLGLSVPVVSSSLAELEKDIGVTLASRSTRHFQLTNAGTDIHELAKRMLDAADQALNYQTVDRTLSGKLAITVAVEIASNWLPKRLKAFQNKYPDVHLQIESTDDKTHLATSPFDLAITGHYARPDIISKKQLAHKQHVQLVCAAGSSVTVTREGDTFFVDHLLFNNQEKNLPLTAYSKTEDKLVEVVFRNNIFINNHETSIALAKENIAAILIHDNSIKNALLEKQLYAILPELNFGYILIETVFRDKLPTPAACAFSDFLIDDYND